MHVQDPYVTTFHDGFYQHYLDRWPILFQSAIGPDDGLVGYIMGKLEGSGEDWHGHVSAVVCGTSYRRRGIASMLMDHLERVSIEQNAYYVDLFVRASNSVAIEMYKKRGYVVYRRIIQYYSGMDPEDGLDMRLPLPRDVEQYSIRRPHKQVIMPSELDFD